MNYYLDTEFCEDGRTIDLISIALVTDDDREFYAVSNEADLSRANGWVKANVLPHLPPTNSSLWMSRAEIRDQLLAFVGQEKPMFWTYYGSYDWIALAQLFGPMIALPKHFPMFCMDLKQLAVSLGDPPLPKQASGQHNALHDARWNREVHAFLTTLQKST